VVLRISLGGGPTRLQCPMPWLSNR
jgi:hypothetical protein